MREVVLLGGYADGRRLDLDNDVWNYLVLVPWFASASKENSVEEYLASPHSPRFMVLKGWRLDRVHTEPVVCSLNILDQVTADLREARWVQEAGAINYVTNLHESIWLVPGPRVEA